MTDKMLLSDLKTNAQVAMLPYPQYRGHFDGYVLVKMKCHVKTKVGLAFTKDEYAIAAPGVREGKFMTVWSARSRVDTSVSVSDVQLL